MILREASSLTAIGVVLGAAAASLLTRYVQSMLYDVSPLDPLTMAGAVVVMMTVAVAAGCQPARRAAHVDPVVALRHE